MDSDRPFLPFALPDIGSEEIAEVVRALESGWITTGPKTKQFEADFAAFIGGGVDAVAVNSATAGLHLALEAVGISAGDEVITTPYTFTATAEVISYLGAHPVFADIDQHTLNISAEAVESCITVRTKAIIPVHIAGLACDMDAVIGIARRHGLRVIEDAAHALPASYRGRRIGSLDSDATVFSFYATKPVATGEGGMIVSRDAAVLQRCRLMRLHGISRDAFDRYVSRTPAWRYEVLAPGFKYNMTDVAASLGIHQLRKAAKLRERREQMALRYDRAFGHLPVRLPAHAESGDEHAWHLYVIRLTDSAPLPRDAFIDSMADRGIGCSVHFIPLHLQPYWRDTYRLTPESFPAATAAFSGAVSLPIYTRMSDGDQDRVIEETSRLLR